jgi:GH15 family glucan-1,4-alpha-glucosidase
MSMVFRPVKDQFLPSSFWLVDCLSLMGRHAEAHALFQRLLTVGSSLGLLSEE